MHIDSTALPKFLRPVSGVIISLLMLSLPVIVYAQTISEPAPPGSEEPVIQEKYWYLYRLSNHNIWAQHQETHHI